MSLGFFRTRRFTLMVACVASCFAGLAMVWLFAPRNFGGLRTLELVGIFSLFLLPALGIWVVLADRAAQKKLTDLHRHQQRQAELDAMVATSTQRVSRRSVIHEPAYSSETSHERV